MYYSVLLAIVVLAGHAPCEEFDTLYSKALDGFIAILSNEGDLVYISESVSKYLGIQQVRTYTLQVKGQGYAIVNPYKKIACLK